MIETLIKYQDKDSELKKIEVEIAGSEERKKAIVAKKYIDGAGELVEKLDLKAAELVMAYENATKEEISLKEQEKEINEAIDSLESENELNFLLKKVEEVISKIKALGQRTNSINQEIQALIKEYASVKMKYNAAKVQFNEYGEKYQALKASKKGEVDAINQELEKLKKEVDPNLMALYQKKRAENIFPICYEVKMDVCPSCSMNLSMSDIAKLKNGDVIECDNCRKLLFKK